MQKSYSITIKGKVQGVFFRKNTLKKALELRIEGTVQNLDDGCVYIVATAEEPALNQFILWCNVGEGKAVVEKVQVTELDVQEYQYFTII
jgi:acylphosphatase